MSIGIDDIREAAARIAPVAHRTPVMTSRTFDEMTGVTAFFKCENFQRAGAFKIRGAANAVFALDEETRKRGVVAYSSGNHAQAVALAARIAGIPATIVMPSDAPKAKMEGTRGYGARVVTYDRMTEDRAAICARIGEETGASVIPPFDHPKVIAGQGTAGLELLEAIPDLDALVVCISGGGLISGCATAAKTLRPGIRVFGVEPEGADDTRQSLAAGKRIRIPPPTTIADGLRVECPGELTFPIMQRLLEGVVTVSDAEIRATMKFFLLRMKMLVEPSGATAAAAVMHGKVPPALGRVGIVVSGGNVDWEMLMTL